jgi:hypothetical protein
MQNVNFEKDDFVNSFYSLIATPIARRSSAIAVAIMPSPNSFGRNANVPVGSKADSRGLREIADVKTAAHSQGVHFRGSKRAGAALLGKIAEPVCRARVKTIASKALCEKVGF